jgi:predicted Rossmann-fold nucleotide-binding protein
MPIVLVGEAFWRRALDTRFLADEGMIAPEDLEIIQYAETAADIWRLIREWESA